MNTMPTVKAGEQPDLRLTTTKPQPTKADTKDSGKVHYGAGMMRY